MTDDAEAISDQALGDALRCHRAQPEASRQAAFWQELERKLDDTPQAPPASRLIWLRAPWTSAAAVLAVILLSFPLIFPGQQAQQPQLSQLSTEFDAPEMSRDTAQAPQPASPPMQLGAAAPPAESEPVLRAQKPAESDSLSLGRSETKTEKAKKSVVGENSAVAEPKSAFQGALEALVKPLQVEVEVLAEQVFELRLAQAQAAELKQRLKAWEVPHELQELPVATATEARYQLRIVNPH